VTSSESWPALPYREWAPTAKTLHLVTQMVGKARLGLAPPQPEWAHASLYLGARGFTTGAVPTGTGIVSLAVDLFDNAIRIRASDGHQASVRIGPHRAVAQIWAEFRSALAGLGITVDIWDKPQEMEDTTRFSGNTGDAVIEPGQAQRFHRALCSIDRAFETFRSGFFGRTGIQFWWGGFDLCVSLFTGRHVPAPQNGGYIQRYDLDAEHLNAGFWAGDETTPEPRFFGYVVPQPPGCEIAPINPAHAAWEPDVREWTMSYDEVRRSAEPQRTLLDFLDSIYRVAVTNGGWDAAAHRYAPPGPAPRR
jgi:hypothetical protein